MYCIFPQWRAYNFLSYSALFYFLYLGGRFDEHFVLRQLCEMGKELSSLKILLFNVLGLTPRLSMTEHKIFEMVNAKFLIIYIIDKYL